MSNPSRSPGSTRVVHTSDWHLGIELGTFSRRADHETAIDSLVGICAEFSPDAIVHSGDLFDHARPGADDQQLAVEGLRRLAEIAPVVVVAGNHDNGPMLDGVWDPLVGLAGSGRIHFRGRLRRPDDGGTVALPAADGTRRVIVCTVPFVTPHSFARWDRPGETTTSFTDGLKRLSIAYDQWLEANVDIATDKVIWAAHLLVAGARPAGSERKVHLADDYATVAADIPAVAYAAFGHIHLPQQLPGLAAGRYAGSLLPFRFDEAQDGTEPKSVVLVELPATGTARVELAPIETGRRLLEVTATVEELAAVAADYKGTFVRVYVPLDAPTPGLAAQVTGALPDAHVVNVIPKYAPGILAAAQPISSQASSLADMLERWLEENPVVGADADRTATLVRSLVGAATDHRRVELPGETVLDPAVAAELIAELTTELDWEDPDAEAAVIDSLMSPDDSTPGGETAAPGGAA